MPHNHPRDQGLGASGVIRDEDQSMTSNLSLSMVRLYKDQFGRGPAKARTDWCNPDLIVCTLEDTLSPAEERLRALGEDQRLREMRMLFQFAAAPQFISAVETLTGRRVRSFISGIDTANDVAVELFFLYPEDDSA